MSTQLHRRRYTIYTERPVTCIRHAVCGWSACKLYVEYCAHAFEMRENIEFNGRDIDYSTYYCRATQPVRPGEMGGDQVRQLLQCKQANRTVPHHGEKSPIVSQHGPYTACLMTSNTTPTEQQELKPTWFSFKDFGVEMHFIPGSVVSPSPTACMFDP
jgi:hypothetical protein